VPEGISAAEEDVLVHALALERPGELGGMDLLAAPLRR
jgi:hypothetical protein